MQRKVTFAVLAIFVCFFVVSFDRWGRRAFLGFALSSINLSKDQKLKVLITKDFPENFLIGSSSSAYQIEGAWDEHGKLFSKNSCTTQFSIFKAKLRQSGMTTFTSTHTRSMTIRLAMSAPILITTGSKIFKPLN